MAYQHGETRSRHLRLRLRWLSWHTLRIVVGVGLLVYLLSGLDLARSLAVVAAARLDLLLLLAAVFAGIRLMAAYRWWLLLRGQQLRIGFANVVRLIFVSGFVGYFMPGGVGNELARVYGLARGPASLALAVSSVLVERLMAILALVLLVLAGIALRPLPGLPPEVGPIAWLGLALLSALVVLLWEPRLRRIIGRHWRGWLMALRSRVVRFSASSTLIDSSPG